MCGFLKALAVEIVVSTAFDIAKEVIYDKYEYSDLYWKIKYGI